MKVEVTFYDGPSPDKLTETKLTLHKKEWKIEGGEIQLTTRMIEFMNRISYAIEDLKQRNKESNAAKRKAELAKENPNGQG